MLIVYHIFLFLSPEKIALFTAIFTVTFLFHWQGWLFAGAAEWQS